MILTAMQDAVARYSLVVGIDFFDPHPKANFLIVLSTVVSLFWQGLVWYRIFENLPDLKVLSLAFVHVSFFSQVR